MSKVTIIIPVYNVEKYLEKCLNSVIRQTLEDIEIICVNDCSTDNSQQILKEYAQKDERIKIVDKKNGGLSSARNAGLDAATGEYCYFLDSDDWIELNTLEKLYKIIITESVDTVVHSAINIPEDDSCIEMANDCQKWFDSFRKENGIYDVPIEINRKIPTVAWNKLYRMDIINKYHCRFPEGLVNEDELFIWTYMIHCKNYYYLDEKLYNYLRRSDSIMGTRDNSPKVLDILGIEEEIYKIVKKYKNIKEYHKYLTKNYINTVKELFHRMPDKYGKEALKRIKQYYEDINNDKKIIILYWKYKYKNLSQFMQEIFSIKNITSDNYVGKQVKILGIKLKFKDKYKTLLHIFNLNAEEYHKMLLHICNLNAEEYHKMQSIFSNKVDLINSNINAKYFSRINDISNNTEVKDYSKTAVLFKYDYFLGLNDLEHHIGVNLGDYVQTLATKNIIKSILPDTNFVFWDRDNLLNYDGQKAYTIMQGWFSHSDTYLPNENILPIFIGTHITTKKRNQFINFIKHNPSYFENITFGCRDTSTLDFLKSIGQKCYLSRCLTLTFLKRQINNSQNKVFIVDIPDEYLKYIPFNLLQNAEKISQRAADTDKQCNFYINTEKQYMCKAQELLNKYRDQAALVITSALHCASPCIAMGIPTILIDFEKNNERFGSLSGVQKIYSQSDLINGRIDFKPREPNIEELKQLMIKNVDLSIKQAFGYDINIEELNIIRNNIENYNIVNN